MRVVGLLSGGKDSVYSLLQCIAEGHSVVAVANLRPAEVSVQELDSHMFQTVGHNAVVGVAACLGVPLFVGTTRGTAVQQGLQYSAAAAAGGDEIEDLRTLLAGVLAHVPDVQAVCAGAIRSNYQRNRVEAVCTQLGLTSLAWLWERREARLLHDMCADGMRCVLLKVATMGLTQKHIGSMLHECVDDLVDLVRPSSVCCSPAAVSNFRTVPHRLTSTK